MSGHVGTKRLVVMNRHDFDGGVFTPVLTFSLIVLVPFINTTLFISTCSHLSISLDHQKYYYHVP